MIPYALRVAADRIKAAVPPLNPEGREAHQGDLAVAQPRGNEPEMRRIVAVMRVDEMTKTAMINLGTNELEGASDLDVILSPEETGLPFGFCIQAELYGPVFMEQLRMVVGSLPDGLPNLISKSLVTDGESIDGLKIGLPLSGADDSRRYFKDQELKDLNRLVSSCRDWLAGHGAEARTFDPELLIPPPTGTPIERAEDAFLELLDAMEQANTSNQISSELIVLLDDEHILSEISRWRSEFGLDAARVLSRFCVTDQTAVDLTSLRRRGPEHILESYLEIQATAGIRTVDVYTSADSALRIRAIVISESLNGSLCRGRAQLVVA